MLTTTPALVIFDKDGTLIDFQHMWGRWASNFALRVSTMIDDDVQVAITTAFGYDVTTQRIDPRGALAIASMATMQQMVVRVIAHRCASPARALQIVQAAWQPPDPTREAQPLADLVQLFTAIHARGANIAIATADDRAPTIATMRHLGLHTMIQAYACADDVGVAPKPAPDKILAVCRTVGVAPAQALMIGDTPADMQMGRNAGVLAQIGVTSGLSSHADLAPLASWTMATVADLLTYWPASG